MKFYWTRCNGDFLSSKIQMRNNSPQRTASSCIHSENFRTRILLNLIIQLNYGKSRSNIVFFIENYHSSIYLSSYLEDG